MKKFLLPLFLMFLLVGCNDDDENRAALIGDWVSEREEVTDCTEPTDNRTISRRCSEASCVRLIMNADGTYSYQRGTFVENGNFSKGSGSLALCIDEEGEEVCTVFGIDENTTVTLVLSSIDENTGCKTSIFFEREIVEDSEDGA